MEKYVPSFCVELFFRLLHRTCINFRFLVKNFIGIERYNCSEKASKLIRSFFCIDWHSKLFEFVRILVFF